MTRDDGGMLALGVFLGITEGREVVPDPRAEAAAQEALYGDRSGVVWVIRACADCSVPHAARCPGTLDGWHSFERD